MVTTKYNSPILSIRDAAATLGLSPSGLRKAEIKAGIIPCRTSTGMRVYDADALDALKEWRDGHTANGASASKHEEVAMHK